MFWNTGTVNHYTLEQPDRRPLLENVYSLAACFGSLTIFLLLWTHSDWQWHDCLKPYRNMLSRLYTGTQRHDVILHFCSSIWQKINLKKTLCLQWFREFRQCFRFEIHSCHWKKKYFFLRPHLWPFSTLQLQCFSSVTIDDILRFSVLGFTGSSVLA